MSFWAAQRQDVEFPVALQSVANINAGVTSTIGSASTEGVAGVQWSLTADQNCIVYVYESTGVAGPWRLKCQFNVYANAAALTGNTVQALQKYVQFRVQNIGLAATTTLELCVALCPVVDAVPAFLSPEGNFKVGVYEIEGQFNSQKVWISPLNALKSVESVRLVGASLTEPLSPNFWSTTVVGSGSVVTGGGHTVLATGVTNASSARLITARTARFINGNTNYVRAELRSPAVVGANEMRWGGITTSLADGCFFSRDNVLGFGVGTRKTGVTTRVPNGSFNGDLGASYVLDTNEHVFQILYTNSDVWWLIDGETLHHLNATVAPWADTPNLDAFIDNVNGANINNNTVNVRSLSIQRLGHVETQPQYLHINTSTTTVLKSGPGYLHNIIIGTLTTADWVITVYDNTSAAAPIIIVLTARGQATDKTVQSVDLHVPFSTGLTVVTAGGTPGDLTVIFE